MGLEYRIKPTGFGADFFRLESLKCKKCELNNGVVVPPLWANPSDSLKSRTLEPMKIIEVISFPHLNCDSFSDGIIGSDCTGSTIRYFLDCVLIAMNYLV